MENNTKSLCLSLSLCVHPINNTICSYEWTSSYSFKRKLSTVLICTVLSLVLVLHNVHTMCRKAITDSNQTWRRRLLIFNLIQSKAINCKLDFSLLSSGGSYITPKYLQHSFPFSSSSSSPFTMCLDGRHGYISTRIPSSRSWSSLSEIWTCLFVIQWRTMCEIVISLHS